MSKLSLSVIAYAPCLNKTTIKSNKKQMNSSADTFTFHPLSGHPTPHFFYLAPCLTNLQSFLFTPSPHRTPNAALLEAVVSAIPNRNKNVKILLIFHFLPFEFISQLDEEEKTGEGGGRTTVQNNQESRR